MVTISSILIIGIISSDGGSKENQTWIKALRIYTITTFSLFLVFYIGVLYLLTSRLHKYFPKFYLKERDKIFLTNGVIILSLIARIIMNIFIFFFMQAINESSAEGTWLFPAYQLCSSILSSLLPIGAIIVSTMYAINHKKRMFNVAAKNS